VLKHVHDRHEVKLSSLIGLQLIEGRVQFEAFFFRQLAVSIAGFHADHLASICLVECLHQRAGRCADIQRAPKPADAVVLHQIQLILRAKALLAQVFGGRLFGGLIKLAIGLIIKHRVRSRTLTRILENKSACLAEVIPDLEAK